MNTVNINPHVATLHISPLARIVDPKRKPVGQTRGNFFHPVINGNRDNGGNRKQTQLSRSIRQTKRKSRLGKREALAENKTDVMCVSL